MIELMLESRFSDSYPSLFPIHTTTSYMSSTGILLHFGYNLILTKCNLYVHFQDKESPIV